MLTGPGDETAYRTGQPRLAILRSFHVGSNVFRAFGDLIQPARQFRVLLRGRCFGFRGGAIDIVQRTHCQELRVDSPVVKLRLDYGLDGLDVDVPDDRTTVIEPVHQRAVADPHTALMEAIRRPLGTAQLAGSVRPGQRVAISVCDVTRAQPRREMVAAVLEELGPVPAEAVTIFIATGTQPPLAADLLEHPAMSQLIDTLKQQYDLVLLDTPPVLAATDATILAKHAGAVFAVARADSTTARELVASQRALKQAGSDIKGVLFNGLHVEGRWYRPHYLYGKYRYMSQYGRQHGKRA